MPMFFEKKHFFFLFLIASLVNTPVKANETTLHYSNDSTAIKMIHKNGIWGPKIIKDQSYLKVWTDKSDKPIKGVVTIIDLENIEIDAVTIPINSIEKLTFINIGGRATGIGVTILGTGFTACGLYLFQYNTSSPNYIYQFLLGLASTTVGLIVTPIGLTILSCTSKSYSLNKWSLSVQ